MYYVRDGQRDDDLLVFHELPEPSAAEVAEVAQRTAARIVKVLLEHDRELDPELGIIDVASDTERDESSALSACYAAAAAGTDLFGERAGSPALRLVDPSATRPEEPVAIAGGTNVHAKVRVHGNDRTRLERLRRYLGRPPILVPEGCDVPAAQAIRRFVAFQIHVFLFQGALCQDDLRIEAGIESTIQTDSAEHVDLIPLHAQRVIDVGEISRYVPKEVGLAHEQLVVATNQSQTRPAKVDAGVSS